MVTPRSGGCRSAFDVAGLLQMLDGAGLELAGFAQPSLYDPIRFLPEGVVLPDNTAPAQRLALAEKLGGGIRVHVAYAAAKGARVAPPMGKDSAVPHLRGVSAAQLARQVGKHGSLVVRAAGEAVTCSMPKASAPLIAAIDGIADLATIRGRSGLDALAFGAIWPLAERVLTGWGQLHYSAVRRHAPADRRIRTAR
ncbi:hypothetical protein LCGC14_3096120 [marine sediment metagenome]|uniref:Uncharacterized protein n=1 Tax=marine sediment metagenome TaxID=412755 RepID=A0A0F8YZB1_9ZZZZ